MKNKDITVENLVEYLGRVGVSHALKIQAMWEIKSGAQKGLLAQVIKDAEQQGLIRWGHIESEEGWVLA